MAPRHWRCANASPPRPMRAPPLTMPPSPTGSRSSSATTAPTFRAIGGKLVEALRYGENPHQSAAFYRTPEQRFGVATARQLQGKQLSYNNINDTDAAYECIAEFDPKRTAAVVIVKHANPCGVAEGASLARGLSQGAGLRPDLGFRRHRRAQPQARRGSGQSHHRDFHRGDHRAGRERGCHRHRRREKESAAAADRRRARPARSRTDREDGRRRPAGAIARQCGGRRHDAEDRHQACADAGGAARSVVCLPRRQAREVEHHRLCERPAPPSASAQGR